MKKKKLGKEEKKEYREDRAAVSGRKWNRKGKKNLFIKFFYGLGKSINVMDPN